MKVLVVCSVNKGKINPFITEQVAALRKLNITIDMFTFTGKGMLGYLRNFSRLKNTINKGHYDLVHAHYGLSGLLAGLQRRKPVITTFHGSDINQKIIIHLSRLAARLSAFNIVVEKSFVQRLKALHKTEVIPCGIDMTVFMTMEKQKARQMVQAKQEEVLLLFTSHFDNPVKNYPLAKAVEALLPGSRLVEMKGLSRQDVNTWMNAADLLLVTSFSEGSPQVVKEALACNLPVVAVPAGDIPQLAAQTTGIHLAPYDAPALARQARQVLEQNRNVDTRSLAARFDNKIIAERIRNIYYSIASK